MNKSNNTKKENISPEESNRFDAAIDEILSTTLANNSDDDYDYDELEHEPYQTYTFEENESEFEI